MIALIALVAGWLVVGDTVGSQTSVCWVELDVPPDSVWELVEQVEEGPAWVCDLPLSGEQDPRDVPYLREQFAKASGASLGDLLSAKTSHYSDGQGTLSTEMLGETRGVSGFWHWNVQFGKGRTTVRITEFALVTSRLQLRRRGLSIGRFEAMDAALRGLSKQLGVSSELMHEAREWKGLEE